MGVRIPATSPFFPSPLFLNLAGLRIILLPYSIIVLNTIMIKIRDLLSLAEKCDYMWLVDLGSEVPESFAPRYCSRHP